MAQEPRIDVETRAQGIRSSLSDEQGEQIADAFGWQGVWFSAEQDGDADTRRPETTWELVADRPHQGVTAKGRAAVHLAEGHRTLTRPLILADGFGHGPSDLDALWRHFNTPYQDGKPGFLDRLRSMGIDVVLLGFNQRHTYLQANAAVAVSCVQRVLAERTGEAPLVVGGVSMGGMVTRYALARMEADGLDHQTDKYFSYDTPHLGAWIPLVLQQLAYLHEALQPPEGGEPGQAELIRSPAAQQLLWGWVDSADFSGPVTANPLRQEFLDDLRRVGWFPMRPYKLGLANGLGTGIGLDLGPGTPVFDLQSADLQLTARVQPDGGALQNVGTIKLGPPVWASATSHVAAWDGAPGGTLDSWGRIADAMGLPIHERLRNSCFVPTVSAIALTRDPYQWQPDLYKDLRDLPKDETLLDAFCCDTANREHSAVSKPLIEWFLEQLAGW
ncbi:esterase/lipase family protein [Nonomuraea terrae]|uniref:esterase/lipase family protein n=1 Tax=Nonomuraea terrae TaxID=2530383 RepID=UPI0037A05E67